MKSSLNVNRCRPYVLRVEALEDRCVPAGFQPSAVEQLMLEQLNDIRADPASYGLLLGIDLSNVPPVQPLAFDVRLIQAARLHSQDMDNRNYFDHNSPEGTDPGSRLTQVDFPWISFGEALGAGAGQPTSAAALAAMILDRDDPSLGHRIHLLGLESLYLTQNVVGIGIVQNGQSPLTNYYTIDTAGTTDGRPFITGSVFEDLNGDGRYDIGEGLGNVRVSVREGSFELTTATFASGGYGIQLNPGIYTVTVSGGGLSHELSQTVVVNTTNVRVNFSLPTDLIQPQDTGWLQMLYQDILGRVPGADELAGWNAVLAAGVPHGAVARAFLYSQEFSERQIEFWFDLYLGRPVDPSGIAAFRPGLQAGVSQDSIRQAILASEEYFALHANDPTQFVNALYADVLGRAPSGGEAANWVLLASRGQRAAVALGILRSQEFKANEVREFYAFYLRRQPDAGGLQHYQNQLVRGVEERDVLQSLFGSQEFYNNALDVMWLQRLYFDVLGRDGDNDRELGNWLAHLRTDMDYSQIVNAFLTSPENRTLTVTNLYQNLLFREPDGQGLTTYVQQLQADDRATDVIIQIASSQEYTDLRGGTDWAFIRGLYFDLLSQGASSLDIGIWLNGINSGMTHFDVVESFTGQPVYQEHYITQLYELYLHRSPTALELESGVAQLNQGVRDAVLEGTFLGSDEYYLAYRG